MLPDYPLASYAVSSTRGRAHVEPADALRGPFALDRQRIINSTAFRRLDGKTQVFAPQFHDHFRNRLEHTLEVASIARTLARALRAHEELTEAITLAHDLGHPPFGHAGEAALNEAMAGWGGFNHNTHSVRVVEYLEHPYPAFRGLNLTSETLDGLRCHETQFDRPESAQRSTTDLHPRPSSAQGSPLPFDPVMADHCSQSSGTRLGNTEAAALGSRSPSVEARIASLTDRIAYDCHDLEDAIGAGFLSQSALRELDLWREAEERAASSLSAPLYAIRRPVLDALLDGLLVDAVQTSRGLLVPVRSPDEAAEALVRLSKGVEAQLASLESFLLEHVYRRPEIASADQRSSAMIGELFGAYGRSPDELPERFRRRVKDQGLERVICDYIAGMTDRFGAREHERLVQRP